MAGTPTTPDFAGAGGGTGNPVYPGCGHSPHIEFPAEVAAELLRLV